MHLRVYRCAISRTARCVVQIHRVQLATATTDITAHQACVCSSHAYHCTETTAQPAMPPTASAVAITTNCAIMHVTVLDNCNKICMVVLHTKVHAVYYASSACLASL